MPKKKAAAPPIRVGTKQVTYTPPAPWPKDDRYQALVFHCELERLTLDGAEVEMLDPEQNYYGHDVRARLRTPDGQILDEVPYKHCTEDEAKTGSWCRPWISSAVVRYG